MGIERKASVAEVEDQIIADDVLQRDAAAACRVAAGILGKAVFQICYPPVGHREHLRTVVVETGVGGRLAMEQAAVRTEAHPIDGEALGDPLFAVDRIERAAMILAPE